MMSSTLSAEYVFLKNGSIVKCRIEAETKTSITGRMPNGKPVTFNARDIIRILYTELYMGKIFVNKTDGTVIEAYMVDEDQTSYTFRKELYSPNEFRVRRDEVLFTTRKNPSGLAGTAESDRIEITWKAPYTPVSKYKVYFKSSVMVEKRVTRETIHTQLEPRTVPEAAAAGAASMMALPAKVRPIIIAMGPVTWAGRILSHLHTAPADQKAGDDGDDTGEDDAKLRLRDMLRQKDVGARVVNQFRRQILCRNHAGDGGQVCEGGAVVHGDFPPGDKDEEYRGQTGGENGRGDLEAVMSATATVAGNITTTC